MRAVAVSPIDSNTVYAGTDLGIFVSLDGGETWARDLMVAGRRVTQQEAAAMGERMPALLDRSHGRRLWDARRGRRVLDMFSFFATLPVGLNHPKLKDPDFLAALQPDKDFGKTMETAEQAKTMGEIVGWSPEELVGLTFRELTFRHCAAPLIRCPFISSAMRRFLTWRYGSKSFTSARAAAGSFEWKGPRDEDRPRHVRSSSARLGGPRLGGRAEDPRWGAGGRWRGDECGRPICSDDPRP